MKCLLLPVFLVSFLFLNACKKEGVLHEDKQIIEVAFSSFWTDPAAVSTLTMGSTMLTDSFSSKNPKVVKQVIEKTSGNQRVMLKDNKTGRIWFDTSLLVKGGFFSATILQLGESAPQLVMANDEQMDPAKRDFGFYYSDPTLPDSLTLELYRVIVTTNVIVSGADKPYIVFNGIVNGKFSGFTAVPYYYGFGRQTERVVFKLKNAKTGEYLPNAGEIDPLRYTKGGRMTVPVEATMEAMYHHIFSIKVNVRPTGNTYISSTIVSY